MYRFTWDAFVTPALLDEVRRAVGLPAGSPLENVRALIARILASVGGLPFSETRLSAAERTRRARAWLDETVVRALSRLSPPLIARGYVTQASEGDGIEQEIIPVDRVAVNSANATGLTALTGVSAAAAARIVAERGAHGPFASLAELKERVSGLSDARVDAFAHAVIFDVPGDVERIQASERGDFRVNLAALAARQPGPSAGAQLRQALELAAAESTEPRHPAARRYLVREAPDDEQTELDAEWLGIWFGTEYYNRLPGLLAQASASIDVCMFHAAYAGERHPTRRLLDALVDARGRGVAVRVLLDQDRAADPYLSTVINTPAKEFLESHDVACRFDRADRLLHSKFLVVDRELAVLGSHNWSAGSYFQFDDASVVVKSPALSRKLRQRFDRLWRRH